MEQIDSHPNTVTIKSNLLILSKVSSSLNNLAKAKISSLETPAPLLTCNNTPGQMNYNIYIYTHTHILKARDALSTVYLSCFPFPIKKIKINKQISHQDNHRDAQ